MKLKIYRELSSHQDKVFAAFHRFNTDIDIAVLYTRIYGDAGQMTARDMQQKLAPTFKAINCKISGVIEPGETKRTYRLNTTGE